MKTQKTYTSTSRDGYTATIYYIDSDYDIEISHEDTSRTWFTLGIKDVHEARCIMWDMLNKAIDRQYLQ